MEGRCAGWCRGFWYSLLIAALLRPLLLPRIGALHAAILVNCLCAVKSSLTYGAKRFSERRQASAPATGSIALPVQRDADEGLAESAVGRVVAEEGVLQQARPCSCTKACRSS